MTYSEHKKDRESRMAQYAADNWGKSDIQKILLAMGLEQKTINTFATKSRDEVKTVIQAWIMRR